MTTLIMAEKETTTGYVKLKREKQSTNDANAFLERFSIKTKSCKFGPIKNDANN